MNFEGQTAYIVGKGPSVLRMTREHFGPGPVISLNQAIWNVRALNLPNPIFAMQKDGCAYHGPQPGFEPPGPDHECGEEIVRLIPPETLIVAKAESLNCLPGYEPRIVVDVEAFGIPWYTPSSPTATKIAISWGCSRIVYLAHDGYTHGDFARVYDQFVVQGPDLGYTSAGQQSAQFAAAAGIPVEWVTP